MRSEELAALRQVCDADLNEDFPDGINASKVIELLDLIKKLQYDKRYCPCGGIILADTEDCRVPLCYNCVEEIARAMKGTP